MSWISEPRSAAEVVEQLLAALEETVTSYHPSVQRTGRHLHDLVDGTSFFPGGTGLWRGQAHGGPLPDIFPNHPVMFVGHNFDSQRAFARSLARRGEATGQFWKFLLSMLAHAGLPPAECFFTNALMGLKPGSATGPMPRVLGYLEQCTRFLEVQANIVHARCVVALGANAAHFAQKLTLPSLAAKHPSSWIYCPGPRRGEGVAEEGRKLAAFLATLPPPR